jgi:hypothetical protein
METAEETLHRAVVVPPNDPDSYTELSMVLVLRGKISDVKDPEETATMLMPWSTISGHLRSFWQHLA